MTVFVLSSVFCTGEWVEAPISSWTSQTTMFWEWVNSARAHQPRCQIPLLFRIIMIIPGIHEIREYWCSCQSLYATTGQTPASQPGPWLAAGHCFLPEPLEVGLPFAFCCCKLGLLFTLQSRKLDSEHLSHLPWVQLGGSKPGSLAYLSDSYA